MPVFNNALAGAAGSGGAAAYEIERSLRFNDDDSAYLSRTPSSAGNRKTWTFSTWCKIATPEQAGIIFNAQNGTTQGFADNFWILFYAGTLVVGDGSYDYLNTNKLRDASAWYHIVVACDTTQSSASDRLKIYINGVESTYTGDYRSGISQNSDTAINSTYLHRIGDSGSYHAYFDGYLADTHFIDGQALAPTDFGAPDATTGVWNPKRYSGTYGTNGFHLDFSDNSSSAALGTDSSGNNNTWTVNNLIAQGPSTATQFKVYGNASTSGSSSTINVSSLTTLQGTNVSSYNIGGTSYNHLTADLGSVGTHAIQARTYLNTGSDILVFVSDNGSSWSSISNQQDPYIFTGRYIQWVRTSQGYDNQVLTAVSAESETDSLLDSPTNYEADSGNNGGNYATLNPLTNGSGSALTNGNLDVTTTTSAFGDIGATIAPSSGKFYVEFVIKSDADRAMIGIASDSTFATSTQFHTLVDGYAYYSQSGVLYNNSNASTFGDTYGGGDVIGVALDKDNNRLYFSKNGTFQNSANPSAGTGGVDISSVSGKPSFIIVNDVSGQAKTSVAFNAGQRPFAYTPPTGFKSLCTQNLDDPLIAKGSDYFDTSLWTGNGSTQSITGLSFSPDLVWYKSTSNSYWHGIFDTVRGVNNGIFPNSTQAETNYTAITAFNSDGYAIGNKTDVNTNNETYVGWAWDAGTSTVSNTDGSITANVRANQSAGFSIISANWTSSGGTIGHGLNAVPEFIIAKNRDNTSNWPVWATALGSGKGLILDGTLASYSNDYLASTLPTSSVITVRDFGSTSASDYIVYAFTSVKNYSSFGSYEGNASSDGPFVYTGFRPKFLLMRNADVANSWYVVDSERNEYNPTEHRLHPNTTDTEAPMGESFDFLSNGFKVRATGASLNGSGNTHIYAAFAEHPFKTARAR